MQNIIWNFNIGFPTNLTSSSVSSSNAAAESRCIIMEEVQRQGRADRYPSGYVSSASPGTEG